MPTWVIPLLRPPSLKNTMSPGRTFDFATLWPRLYFHCPLSLMGSLWPNLRKTILVRHVQLILLRLQVAYLYLVPMYLLAARTTSLPEARPLAVATGSLRSAALGGVSSTSEGSLGPALPSVNEPCDGEPSASEAFSDAVSELCSGVVLSSWAGSPDAYCSSGAVCAPAASAAKETRTEANTHPDMTIKIRRMSPPPR